MLTPPAAQSGYPKIAEDQGFMGATHRGNPCQAATKMALMLLFLFDHNDRGL